MLLLFLLVSCTAAVIFLAFCSNVFAVLTLRLDRCFELSFACCNTDFIESKFENMMQFASLNADTVLSATLVTNFVYACVMESGDDDGGHLLIKPKLSLYGLHTDWSELMISFCDSINSSEVSLAVWSDCSW